MDAEVTQITDKPEIPVTEPYQKGITVDDITNLKIANPRLTITQAAKILNCHHTNIVRHLDRAGLSWTALNKQLDIYKEHRADIVAFKGLQALKNITPAKLEKDSALQNSTTFCQLFDKERLLRNESTENIAYHDIADNLEDIDRQLAEIASGSKTTTLSATDMAKINQDLDDDSHMTVLGPDGKPEDVQPAPQPVQPSETKDKCKCGNCTCKGVPPKKR